MPPTSARKKHTPETAADTLTKLVSSRTSGMGSHFMSFARLDELAVLARVSKAMRHVSSYELNRLRENTTIKTLTSLAKHPDIAGKPVRYSTWEILDHSSKFPDINIINQTCQVQNTTLRLERLVSLLAVPLEYYLRHILSSKVELNKLPSEAIGPLIQATKTLKINKTILDLAIKIRKKLNKLLFSLIHGAVLRNYTIDQFIALLNALLERGVDVNARDDYDHTPLMEITGIKFSDGAVLRVINILLAAGADLNARPSWRTGATVLSRACCSTIRPQIIKALLAAGIDISAHDRGGRALFYCIVDHSDYHRAQADEALQILIAAKANVNSCFISNKTVLMDVISNKRADLVERLIDAKADVDKVDDYGQSALMLACSRCCVMSIKLLLNARARVNITSHVGNTAFMMLCTSVCYAPDGNNILSELAPLFIQAGADINIKNKDGETALSLYLSLKDKPDGYKPAKNVIDLLIELGARQPSPTQCLVM